MGVMCLVAICIFALTVHLSAWQRAGHMLLGLWTVPSGPVTAITPKEVPAASEKAEILLEVQSIHVKRRVSLILICIVELSSAYLLLLYGCIWLSHTSVV